jgi:hypothetical protein
VEIFCSHAHGNRTVFSKLIKQTKGTSITQDVLEYRTHRRRWETKISRFYVFSRVIPIPVLLYSDYQWIINNSKTVKMRDNIAPVLAEETE